MAKTRTRRKPNPETYFGEDDVQRGPEHGDEDAAYEAFYEAVGHYPTRVVRVEQRHRDGTIDVVVVWEDDDEQENNPSSSLDAAVADIAAYSDRHYPRNRDTAHMTVYRGDLAWWAAFYPREREQDDPEELAIEEAHGTTAADAIIGLAEKLNARKKNPSDRNTRRNAIAKAPAKKSSRAKKR